MDVFVYGCDPKEEIYFEWCRKQYQLDIEATPQKADMHNVSLCKGCKCISILSTPMPSDLITAFHEQGVEFISTRTIGYDHIDLTTCKKLYMHVNNVTYSPESVADYTIMLMLMALRKMKLIMQASCMQDYSFTHVEGKNLKKRTIGVIGCGNIGSTLIRHLSGFECNILVYNRHVIKEIMPYAQFTDLDSLYAQSDIITLHLPLFEESRHMISDEAIAKMKDGVIIVNTARGGLIDNKALIKGITSNKIGAAALDVIEGETGIYYSNQKGRIIDAADMAILRSFPNVLLTPHMAFLTEESTRDMVLHSMQDCKQFLEHSEQNFII